MAGKGIQGSSSMALLLQNNSIFSQNIDGLLRPASSSSVGYMGTQSVMNFAQGQDSRIMQPVFWPVELEEAATNDEIDDCLNRQEKKRRLSVDQVQFLEKSFEVENKLEPERKIQLAKDLGLQPRQVAIWFQNRRARWKTKHLEKEFEALKCSYDTLKIDYDNLLKEKEQLQAKVLSFTNKLQKKEKEELVRYDMKKDERCKQEDISCANSTMFDSESPHRCIDRGLCAAIEPTCSSNAAFEQAQSDHSQVCEVDDSKGCELLALQDNSCSYDIQAFWSFWS